MSRIDLTGQRFGQLIAVEVMEGQRINGGLAWLCRCDCGTEKVFASGELRRGRAWSCGCGMPRSVDIAGQRFGRLTALSAVDGQRIHGSLAWLCRCDCGTEKVLSSDTLRAGRTQSCGCNGIAHPINLADQRFGSLLVLGAAEGQRIHGSLAWLCRCDCGTEKVLASNALRTSHTQSCGCGMHAGTHGQSSRQGKPTPEYMAWEAMKQRCLNPRHKAFPRYGGRGITVCPEWIDSFEAFFAHVGPRPGPEYSLDRYPDNNGNYEPGNVRWTTWEEQNRNQRPRTPGLKRPGRRKGPPRYAECHPDRPHEAKGLCHACYQAAWYQAHRSPPP